MKKIIWSNYLFIVLWLSMVTLSHAASSHEFVEGYYGGNFTTDCEYELLDIDMTQLDFNEHTICTRHYNHFSILPSILVNGTLHGEDNESTGSGRTYGNVIITAYDTTFNIDININYNEEDEENGCGMDFMAGSFLNINGTDYLQNEDIVCIIMENILQIW